MKKCFTLSKCFAAFTLSLFFGAAAAQTFPAHPIKIVIPYAPGGGTDIMVRAIAPAASASLGQPIVIENKPGGSSIIGTETVVKSAADGYTLLATDSALLINPGLYKSKLPFDTLKSLQGVTMLATAPVVLVTHPSVPAKNLAELIALAKAKPGALSYGSGGTGTAVHLAGELLKQAANIDIMHVPYKGTGPALSDLVGGHVSMLFTGISSVRQFVESGKLRAIAVTGKQRNPAMPEVPTFAESGLVVESDSYWGLYAPAGVPKEILETISQHFARALHTPENMKKLAELGYTPIGNTPQEHTRQLRAMVDQWTAVVDKAHIRVD